jgi:heavy metal efflux system protein
VRRPVCRSHLVTNESKGHDRSPIQMRFNELIAGVQEDLAIKVFGDKLEPMRRAANQIAGIGGAAKVKVEDVTGMPVL